MDSNFDLIRDEVKVYIRTALKKKSVVPLEYKYKSFQHTDKDVRVSFDQAFRDVQLELIAAEVNVGLLEELITLAIEACRRDILTFSTPVTLLSDIFDLLTLDDCKKMFYYVENRVSIWKEDLFFSCCKNILLRMCNDLLRRLSKSNSTIFCGRILLFLAKFFPFSERSGLNIVSEFNLGNITEYGTESVDTKKVTEKEVVKGKMFIDYSLYCKFWSLQDFFRNPNQCYDKVQWKLFCAHAGSIVSTFEGLKLEHLDKSSPNDKESINNYFSKYLTNQKLLDLQLYDVNFRRSVLVQFLILFQYLTTTSRFKTSVELSPEQKFFIQATADKVHALLKETPPDGDEFETIVSKILAREEHWNAWKNDGCPEFRKALPQGMSADAGNETRPPRRQLGDIIKESHAKGVFHLGNTELTKLWNLNPDNLEACKAKERDFLPSLDDYFADAIEQVSNDELSRDSLLKDGYGWRALRLLARRSNHFFVQYNLPIRELSAFLEMMVSRIASTKNTNASNGEDQEDEEDLFRQSEEAPDADGEFQVPNIIPFRVSVLTVTQFHNICEALRDDWQVLAKKLDYHTDEIDFIVSNNPEEPLQQIKNLLYLWFEEDDDSTLDNFLYILEGLELTDAAEEVKLAIEQNKNLTTDTSNCNEND